MLMADSEKEVQVFMRILVLVCEKKMMKLNVKRSKVAPCNLIAKRAGTLLMLSKEK